MAENKVQSTVAQLVEPLLEEMGYELVELKYEKEAGNWFLRFFIDKPEGITVDDCSLVSHKAGEVLEKEDFIPHHYFLEVSSPGIFRPLKKAADYARFKGEQVEIATFAPVDGKKKFSGELAGLVEDKVVLLGAKGEEINIPLASVAKARLNPDL